MPSMFAAQQSIGDILHPLYAFIAGMLAFFYSIVPSYGAAIIMLTVVVMVLLSPLTVKSTRSMVAMQRLAPEMKKLQAKYKGDRQKLNEEMMALYKQHNASPLGGCLPLILQMPVFLILYQVIRGLTNTVGPNHVLAPKYISHTSLLYQHLVASGGKMMWWGIDLTKSARSVHGGFGAAWPYYILIIVAVAVQYLQIRQLNSRNPQAAAANPQAMAIQKFTPLIFIFLYISFPAGATLYFVVSSMFRLVQQELMFRFDPVLTGRRAAAPPREIDVPGDSAGGAAGPMRGLGGWLSRRAALGGAAPSGGPAQGHVNGERSDGAGDAGGRAGATPAGSERAPDASSGNGTRQLRPGAGGTSASPNGRPKRGASSGGRPKPGGQKPKTHPRSQAKRPRRPR